MKKLLAAVIFFLVTSTYCQTDFININDQQIKLKITSLANDIINKQGPDGAWKYSSRTTGATALHLLALSSAGVKEKHPAIQKGINYILQNFPKGDVYSMGLYAAALQKINQTKYKQEITNAATWLVNTQKNGTWNYTGSNSGDNSVTQFALLGLKAAIDVGIHIPKTTLAASRDHFINSQSENGGWGYSGKSSSTASMTCAALASLSVCELEEEISLELRQGPRFCGSYQINRNIRKSLIWLHNSISKNPKTIFGNTYTAYACERAGIFFDKKKIGKFDWFKLGASEILQSNNNTGKYLPEAFKLLFLAKGNTPILFNKVRWGSNRDWNRRHRDIRNMTRLFTKTLNQKVDWQTVPLDIKHVQFGQAPILYISGLREFKLNTEERLSLKSFIEDGGTLLIAPCLKSKTFINSIYKELKLIYSNAIFTDLPKAHDLRRMYYNLQKLNIPLKVLKNNCSYKRIFITTSDISLELEANRIQKISKYSLANLIKFALKEKPLISKLTQKEVAKAKIQTEQEFKFQDSHGTSEEGIEITQVLYGHDINKINPDAMNNALGYMRKSLQIPTKAGINLISLKDYKTLSKQPVLYMTGDKEFILTDTEKFNLKRYIDNGGFLFADSACSCEEFKLSFSKLIKELFPDQALKKIPLSNPVYQIPFKHDISFTKELARKQDSAKPFLLGIRHHERYSIIFSPYDFSSSLTGQLDEQSMGLKTISSLKLITNIVSYGLSF